MSPLTFNMGPLPRNGDRADASTFLEEWVNNTDVAGIGADSLSSDVALVTSQTDAPSGALRKRGQLWFQRGLGRLWIFDDPDRDNTTYSSNQEQFVRIAPDREILMEVDQSISAGQVVWMRRPASAMTAFYKDSKGRQTGQFFSHGNLNGSGASGRAGIYTYVAQEAIVTGRTGRCTEWGFCGGLIASGFSDALVFVKMNRADPLQEYGYLYPRAVGWSGETNYQIIGSLTESNAEGNLHIRTIFKRPTTDYAWIV